MTKKIIIATRESALALWQAQYVAALIEKHTPYKTELLPMTTEGDQRLEVTLSKLGGKGLFLKELEQAMLSGDADLAVHSMKDVPAELPEGFTLCGVFSRDDPADAFVSNDFGTISELPENAVVGTSSLRRQAQLLAWRPDIQVKPLRGNVNTRLAKLDAGQYDAIILAAAGLNRLSFNDRVASRLTVPQWLPAIAQGAIGMECLSHRTDLIEALAALNDQNTWQAIQAERALNARLEGSCSVAIGGHAIVHEGMISLQGGVFSEDGKVALKSQARHPDPLAVGYQVADDLLDQGARAILNVA